MRSPHDPGVNTNYLHAVLLLHVPSVLRISRRVGLALLPERAGLAAHPGL